jgi:hypothetical protein
MLSDKKPLPGNLTGVGVNNGGRAAVLKIITAK